MSIQDCFEKFLINTQNHQHEMEYELETLKKEVQKELSVIPLIGRKVMPVLSANKMGKLISPISSYENFGKSQYERKKCSLSKICETALSHAENLFKESEAIHRKNIEALENNRIIRDGIFVLMESIGLPASYETRKFNNTKKDTYKKHDAGWTLDIERAVKDDDEFESARQQYDEFKTRVEAYRQSETERAEAARRENEEKLKKDKDVAKAIVFLNSQGMEIGKDFTLENAVEKARVTRLSEPEYLSENAGKLINSWLDGYTIVDTQFVEEWRWGNKYSVNVKSEKTGKTYTTTYLTESGDGSGSFDNINCDLVFTEIKGE